eukprot:Sdes_comp16711_c0_seq1m5997
MCSKQMRVNAHSGPGWMLENFKYLILFPFHRGKPQQSEPFLLKMDLKKKKLYSINFLSFIKLEKNVINETQEQWIEFTHMSTWSCTGCGCAFEVDHKLCLEIEEQLLVQDFFEEQNDQIVDEIHGNVMSLSFGFVLDDFPWL